MAQAIPLIIAVAGQAYNSYQQRQQQKYAASVDEANAKLAVQQANAAEEAQRRSNALEMGRTRAAVAESGFVPNSGTMLNLQTRNAQELELDALTTRYRGQLEAMGLKADAYIHRKNASTVATQGFLNAAGTIYGAQANYIASSMRSTLEQSRVG